MNYTENYKLSRVPELVKFKLMHDFGDQFQDSHQI